MSGGAFCFGSPIPGLLFRSCPSAVAGLVIPVNIDSVERSTFRTPAHVFSECLIAIFPFITHCYSALTIYSILWISLVETSAFSVAPSFIFFAFFAFSVWIIGLSVTLAFQASATFCNAGPERASKYQSSDSAVTQAEPFYKNAAVRTLFLHSKSSVSFSCQYLFSHSPILTEE